MKSLLTICISLMTLVAQPQSKTFVRIFDEQGHKIHKGFMINTSDSSIIISSNNTSREVPIRQIGKIKLRRSFGHTVLVTTVLFAGSMAILGAATADPNAWIFGYTAGEGALLGIMGGVMTGVPVGSIVGGTRNRPEIIIHGKQDLWMKATEMLKPYHQLTDNKSENKIRVRRANKNPDKQII